MKTCKADVISRQDAIMAYLRKNNNVSIHEVAKHFSVSIATIRRDISALNENGEAVQCKGGMCIIDSANALPMFDEERFYSSFSAEKDAIAAEAAALIADGDTVFINSSSTALRIISHIKGKSATIITNNGRSLFEPREIGVDLIIIGGEVVSNTARNNMKMSMTGSMAVDMINKISANKCILGVSGISAEGGLTSMAVQDPAVNQAMIKNTNGPIIVVADHRKIGVKHNFFFSNISAVTHIITDSSCDPQDISKLKSNEIIVIEAKTY